MQLAEVVDKYRQIAGQFARPVPLESFGLGKKETEWLFSGLDEDYHISRFFQFSLVSGATPYTINGFPHSHVSIAAEIEKAL